MGTALSEQSIKAGRVRDMVFRLKLGETYTVYGINMWKGTLNYLTLNQAGTVPIWSPAELFEVVDGKMPADWYFKYLGHSAGFLDAAWGYKDLTYNPPHYDGLLGEDKKEIERFFSLKKEMDK
jgi:hypothetical protein